MNRIKCINSKWFYQSTTNEDNLFHTATYLENDKVVRKYLTGLRLLAIS